MRKERQCLWPKCDVPVLRPHLCCIYHWNKLPARIKVSVQERINAWKDSGAAESFLVDWVKRNSKTLAGGVQ